MVQKLPVAELHFDMERSNMPAVSPELWLPLEGSATLELADGAAKYLSQVVVPKRLKMTMEGFTKYFTRRAMTVQFDGQARVWRVYRRDFKRDRVWLYEVQL